MVQSVARKKMESTTAPPAKQLGSGSPEAQQAATPAKTVQEQIGLPEDVQRAIEGLLAAEGDEPIYSAILTLLGALNNHNETKPIVTKVQELAASGRSKEHTSEL